jgi:hypothetical protein
VATQHNPFRGKWRIVEMEQWDREYIDLVVPGHVTFDSDNDGSFQFGTVEGWLDCQFETLDGIERVEFSWEGLSESDPACGRGWATIVDGELRGRLFIHAGDDSAFRAQKSTARSRTRAA